jgi:eukaryotic-like serine/threonine-protein kinase
MSRVFLAEETRLGRQVVVKVLPPEMGAGVNAERFEREIQLAARLQHPHIVPLLTAGAAGDLLYYVMPFIQGESLRVKLAREGELPVGDAARILREVVDALAYAHRHGVVHRDIKPDNILLAEGHAVVTDFGVAKALEGGQAAERAGGMTLTSLGVALGTPTYMAPEQAAADPHVDHRADIYSVGVLAYEMLAGQPPFTAPTPQAMLAAQITQTPEPLSVRRPACPPALSGAIMRCLEKRPADRWQTATELAPQFDAPVTPTGGMAPTSAQPAISSGTEAAIRRAHPGRVALYFAAASAAVLGIVSFLMYRLGLPDWVLWGAAALLLIGLPLMLVTSRHERRRALARTTAVITPREQGHSEWFTWRRALLGGGLAFAALALVAGGYTAMRLLGIGPVGTLVASGVLDRRDGILLADFDNRTADSTLASSVTEAFRVDLAQSPTVRLFDPQAVRDALQRMQRPGGITITPAVAREVAEREGVKAVVTGQIDPVGQGFVLSANLVSAADGSLLTSVRETAADQAALLPAIDKLSSKLRERIGESLVTIRAKPRLEQVTTGSLAALRKYSEALRLEEEDRDEEAIPLLEEAVALDSGFAMAHRKLAVILGNMDRNQARQLDAATRAFAHRDRLPTIERELATAYYYGFVDVDQAKEAAAYRSVLAVDPDNLVALNNLSGALGGMGRFAEAESLALRAASLGRGQSFTQNAMMMQVRQGRFPDARATLERYEAKQPGTPAGALLRGLLAAAEGQADSAERVFRRLRDGAKGNAGIQITTSRALARLSRTRGRLAQAEEHSRTLMQAGEAAGDFSTYLEGAVDAADLDVDLRGRRDRGLETVRAALARHPLEKLPVLNRPYTQLVDFYARVGERETARRLLREYESSVPEGVRRANVFRHFAYGELARADGRLDDAVAAYRTFATEAPECGMCGQLELGELYDRMGLPDSARVAYQRAVETPNLFRVFPDAYTLAPSYKRLGELYEAKGERKKAADYYGKFVDLWKDADAELQPGVTEVRQRLARLAQEPGA